MSDTLARWLIIELENRGWSQRELARRAGISQTTVSQVVSGQREPTFEFCVQIANALKESPEIVMRKAGLLTSRSKSQPASQEQATDDEEQFALLRERMEKLPADRRREVMQALMVLLQAQEVADAVGEEAHKTIAENTTER